MVGSNAAGGKPELRLRVTEVIPHVLFAGRTNLIVVEVRTDAGIRDDARDLARAVAEVAYEQATTRDARNRHSRERRINRAIAEQGRIEAVKSAAKQQE